MSEACLYIPSPLIRSCVTLRKLLNVSDSPLSIKGIIIIVSLMLILRIKIDEQTNDGKHVLDSRTPSKVVIN